MDNQDGKPTITIDNVNYEIESLTDKTKEILALHQEAQQDMLAARRKATISEVAVQSLANMVSASVKEEAVVDVDPVAE
jgi:hypothetical protein